MNYYQEMPKVWISQQGFVETFCGREKIENRFDVHELADFEYHFDGKAKKVDFLKDTAKIGYIEQLGTSHVCYNWGLS
jgi:hypothetical protein